MTDHLDEQTAEQFCFALDVHEKVREAPGFDPTNVPMMMDLAKIFMALASGESCQIECDPETRQSLSGIIELMQELFPCWEENGIRLWRQVRTVPALERDVDADDELFFFGSGLAVNPPKPPSCDRSEEEKDGGIYDPLTGIPYGEFKSAEAKVIPEIVAEAIMPDDRKE